MPRVRSAKALAKRIDLQYFARSHVFRRARLILSIAIPVIAVVWFVAQRAAGNQNAYSSGPLSPAHAVFANNCAVCHTRDAGFRAHVSDKTCLGCHDAPVHTDKQTFTPECNACHVEHQGTMRLSATADKACTECHKDLHTKDGTYSVVRTITGFDKGHPEFWPLRAGAIDPGTIKLNHYVHLQPTLRGPNGPVQMVCEDCHRSKRTTEPWPYSVAAVQPATQQPVAVSEPEAQQRKRKFVMTGGGAYMEPIRYVNQCAACHLLQFDPRIPEPAPHDKPEVVRAFLVRKITEYLASNPRPQPQPSGAQDFLSPILARSATAPVASAPATQESLDTAVANAERLLWKKNCRICHAQTEGSGDALPTSVKAIIPARWMARAEFNHSAHQMMRCDACHAKSKDSRETSDINLPGIANCRQCHREEGTSHNAAEGRCFECHAYHDWRKQRLTKGTLTLGQVRSAK